MYKKFIHLNEDREVYDLRIKKIEFQVYEKNVSDVHMTRVLMIGDHQPIIREDSPIAE